jgi:hypothetical protein
MGVGVDKPRHNHAVSGVDNFALAGDQTLDLATPADGFEAIAADEHRAIFND